MYIEDMKTFLQLYESIPGFAHGDILKKASQVLPFDEEEPLPGLEGPFEFPNGQVLYFDPKVGKYYARRTDRYVDKEDILNNMPWTK